MSKKKRDQQTPAKPMGAMAIAGSWPLHEVLLSQSWKEPGSLVTILVARRHPDTGKVAAASFLMDLACLGLKRVHVKRFQDEIEYGAEMRATVLQTQPMQSADLDLVAKIIYTGVAYAGALGFKPDFVFVQAEPLLGGADGSRCATPVPTGGPDGKPFFVNGPYDDVDRVMAQLRRAVGEGNFIYLIGSGE